MSGSSPRPSLGKFGTADLRGFEARRLQTLQGQLRMSQDAIRIASGIIQCAMEAGQCHARVQTIFASHNQFTYTRVVSTDTFPLYDCYSLSPLLSEKTDKRVCFSSCVRDFVTWLREQGLHFLCTALPLSGGIIHIEAYFIPEQPIPANARALSLWNTVYTQKCVDDSAVSAWNQKCADAIRRGASSFIVCTLYQHSDFYLASETTTLQGIACTVAARHYLTLQPLQDNQSTSWVLNPKFTVMVQWVQDLGYSWTLTMAAPSLEWAYFVVLLDPLVAPLH